MARRLATYYPSGLLVLIILPLYIAFRSISLDDFDSYSFALALHRFSLDLHQPQPPGFPLYIILGRMFLMVCGDAREALTMLSALSGVGVALGMYSLGGRHPLVGIGASLLVCLTPIGWLTAEKALSDTPGLALTLLAMWALWQGREKVSHFILGSLIAGLELGLRPQDSLPLLLLLAGLMLYHFWWRRSPHWSGAGMLAFTSGVLLWLLPTIHAVGGISTYLSHIMSHAAHVRQADSLFSAPLTPLTLHGRLVAFFNTFLVYTIGVTLYDRWDWSHVVRIALAAGVVLTGLVSVDWRRWRIRLLAAWAMLMATQVFLWEVLDRPRLLLPILPPLALLVAEGWVQLRGPRWLAPAVLMGSAFALLRLTMPLAAQLSSVPAPPIQAARYVAAHYPPQETVIAAAGSFRSVQAELPAYRLVYLYRFDPIAARAAVREDSTHYVVIFDRDQFPDDAVAVLSDDGRFVPLEEQVFRRDPRVHSQHAQVRLQVWIPANLVPPEALALPANSCLDIGSMEDGRYLERGWYRPEDIGGVIGRWAGEVPTSTARLALTPGHTYQMTFRALSYPEDQEVALYVNSQPIARFRMSRVWETYTAVLPEAALSETGVNRLEWVHSRLVAPFVQTGGNSSDQRPLAAAYDWLCVSSQ
jgi:hypothetical protein